jgi:gamma-glutamyltranspeptidase/glutathione hydrolase
MIYSLTAVASLILAAQAVFLQSTFSDHPEQAEHDKTGAVASESAVCSRIGIDLLRQGGNAADAMVGTVLCVGVIGMYHSGYVIHSC